MNAQTILRRLGATAGLATLAGATGCSTSPEPQAESTSTPPSASTPPSPGARTATPSTSRSTPARAPEPPARTEPSGATFQDGQYSADGWYGGQPSYIGVTLTVRNSTITAVSITTPATNPVSLGFQRRFAEAAPGAVVGKRLDEVRVDRLAGASGCAEGFHLALQSIQRQAT